MRSGLANVETDIRPLATVLELRHEAWVYTMLSEHPDGNLSNVFNAQFTTERADNCLKLLALGCLPSGWRTLRLSAVQVPLGGMV